MHRRAKSKPVSLGEGWELAVVGEAGWFIALWSGKI